MDRCPVAPPRVWRSPSPRSSPRPQTPRRRPSSRESPGSRPRSNVSSPLLPIGRLHRGRPLRGALANGWQTARRAVGARAGTCLHSSHVSVAPRLQLLVLGPLEVRVDGITLSLGGAKQRVVLAALLLHVNQVV